MSQTYFSGRSIGTRTASLTSVNQGGGEKKAGLALTVGRFHNDAKRPLSIRANDMFRDSGFNFQRVRPIGMHLVPRTNIQT